MNVCVCAHVWVQWLRSKTLNPRTGGLIHIWDSIIAVVTSVSKSLLITIILIAVK